LPLISKENNIIWTLLQVFSELSQIIYKARTNTDDADEANEGKKDLKMKKNIKINDC